MADAIAVNVNGEIAVAKTEAKKLALKINQAATAVQKKDGEVAEAAKEGIERFISNVGISIRVVTK